MASDDARPSEYRCDVAACGPNRGGARSFRAGGAIFHFTVRLDAWPLPCRCLPAPLRTSVETKTPPGGHHSGVIAAQTRKGGSAFSRANCRNPGTKGLGGRFDSRLWNPEFFCSCFISGPRGSVKTTRTLCGPAVDLRPARPRGSATAWIRPERYPGILRDAQGLVQVRFVENVPEPDNDLAIGLRVIDHHNLDR